MPNIINLPQNMKRPGGQSKNPPPGDHGVRVMKMLVQSPTRITALYDVVDAGEWRGSVIWDNFNLEFERGHEMMNQFLDAIGIAYQGTALDLDVCEGKTLCVTIRHKEQWVNVISHRPDF